MGCSFGGELAHLSGMACFVKILLTHKIEMSSYEKQASSIACVFLWKKSYLILRSCFLKINIFQNSYSIEIMVPREMIQQW